MKAFVAIACIFALINAYSMTNPPSMQLFIRIMINSGKERIWDCLKENFPERNLNDKFDNVAWRDLLLELRYENMKMACVQRCLMKKMDMILPDGTINGEMWSRLLKTEKVEASRAANYVNCLATLKVDSCEDLNKFEKCDSALVP